MGESPHSGVLSDIYRCAHRALSVHEILEREAEVRHLPLGRALRPLERLDKPFSQADKVSGQQ